MSFNNIDEDIISIVNELIEEIINNINKCDDCLIIDSSVKYEKLDLYLCDNCSLKRHEDSQKVLKDLENLAHEVEQRLQSIENTERELDQWRDQQLQKNRDFWDGKLFN
jgi:5'(3')-deoxyribonucleotidase